MSGEQPPRVPDTILRAKNYNKNLALHIPDPENPDEPLCVHLNRCDETYIVRDFDDGYLIVERKRDGEVMPPVAKEDVQRA